MIRLLHIIFVSCALIINAASAEKAKWDEIIAQMAPYEGPHREGVNTNTLTGKVMCGYQGWFAADGDGSGRGWIHYGLSKEFTPNHCTIDLWPDMSEHGEDEKYLTTFKHADGSPAYVFSSFNQKTVIRHFEWMSEYGIDGVFLQRFGSSLRSPEGLKFRNKVTSNVRKGANLHGRTWAIMYDLSGLNEGEIDSIVIEDWKRLVDRMKITEDKAYLHHNAKPVIAVWGVGFNGNRNYTLKECEKLVQFLNNDKDYGGNTVMLGVPTGWRNLNRDALSDELLHRIIKQADIISPWTVGRYRTQDEASKHAEKIIKPDIEWASSKDIAYMPVVFPGFSWHNLKKTQGEEAKLDQIPRHKGAFLWSQVMAFKAAGADMLYIAMFDEIDEGTAIFKCSNNPPLGDCKFLTYEGLPSDHYLKLAGKAGRILNNELPR